MLRALFIFGLFFQFTLSENILLSPEPKILEDTINASVECVRSILNEGLPEFGMPSFNPLLIGNISINFDQLNLPILTGQIDIDNGVAEGITSWVITHLEGDLSLIPPTYTVTFGLHYDEVASWSDYKINLTIFDYNIWGEGHLFSGVENLNVFGTLKAVVTADGVVLQEFSAPVTLERYNFNITGLYGNSTISEEESELISDFITSIINENPDLFTEILGPILIYIFNALVNDDVGIGIVKTIVQECIIDIIYPPWLH